MATSRVRLRARPRRTAKGQKPKKEPAGTDPIVLVDPKTSGCKGPCHPEPKDDLPSPGEYARLAEKRRRPPGRDAKGLRIEASIRELSRGDWRATIGSRAEDSGHSSSLPNRYASALCGESCSTKDVGEAILEITDLTTKDEDERREHSGGDDISPIATNYANLHYADHERLSFVTLDIESTDLPRKFSETFTNYCDQAAKQ